MGDRLPVTMNSQKTDGLNHQAFLNSPTWFLFYLELPTSNPHIGICYTPPPSSHWHLLSAYHHYVGICYPPPSSSQWRLLSPLFTSAFVIPTPHVSVCYLPSSCPCLLSPSSMLMLVFVIPPIILVIPPLHVGIYYPHYSHVCICYPPPPHHPHVNVCYETLTSCRLLLRTTFLL